MRDDLDAHEHATTLPIQYVVRELIEILGATSVAIIGGVRETRAVAQWTDGRAPQRPHVLRFALQLSSMIADGGQRELARAWWFASNPRLRDRAPIFMLRDLPLADVQGPLLAAARAFAARSEHAPITPQNAS